MASRQSAAFEDMEMAYKRVFESLENEKGESSEAAKKGREFLFVIEHTTADIVRISRSIVDLVEESETKFKEKMQNVRYKADFAEGLEKKLQLLSDSFVERDNARFLLKEIIDQLVGPPSWENQSNEGKYSF